MMKKIVAKPLAACTAAVLMTSALLVPTMAANAAASQNQAQRSAVSSIGESKAKEIALQHAGIGASQVSWIIVQQDYEHGRMEYEVEFYAGNQEYDYEIDASSGKILSFDYDIDRYAADTVQQSNTDIGTEKAKSIALSHAGVKAADTLFLSAEQDYDDGMRAVSYTHLDVYKRQDQECKDDLFTKLRNVPGFANCLDHPYITSAFPDRKSTR